MSDRPRIVMETPCEHGETSPHLIEGTDREVVFEAWTYIVRDECPGGSRRVLEPDEYAKVWWCEEHTAMDIGFYIPEGVCTLKAHTSVSHDCRMILSKLLVGQ